MQLTMEELYKISDLMQDYFGEGLIPNNSKEFSKQIEEASSIAIELNINPAKNVSNMIIYKWLAIDTIKGKWFSLGLHVDFQRWYVDIHFIWWIVTIGNHYWLK